MIARALKEAAAALTGVGVSFVPKVICPLCSPAYTAIVSSLGLPFLATAQYLAPLTVTFLAVAIGSLFLRAETRHGLGPFWLGVVAATGIIAGKFWLGSPSTTYVAAIL